MSRPRSAQRHSEELTPQEIAMREKENRETFYFIAFALVVCVVGVLVA